MPHYTLTLKSIIDSGYDLGLKDYPIFDESYREIINNKIIKRYMFNEIAFETPARFIFELNAVLDREMEGYYNNVYKAYKELEHIGFDKLLKESIGSESLDKFIALQKSGGGNDNISTETLGTQSKTTYNSSDITTQGHKENGQWVDGATTTTEQETDSINLQLHADTPQQGVSENLEDATGGDSDWSNKPFVSSADKQRERQGRTKVTNTGETKNAKIGDDITEESGTNIQKSSDRNYNEITNENAAHKAQNNYDYLETFKKIMEQLKNIDDEVLKKLRFLFLTVY